MFYNVDESFIAGGRLTFLIFGLSHPYVSLCEFFYIVVRYRSECLCRV